MTGDYFYLSHMLECMERIERHCARTERPFFEDELVLDGVLRNLQILAESSQRVSSTLKGEHVGIDWRGLSGFRNVLVHDYLGISVSRISQVVMADLPALKAQLLTLRDLMPKPDEEPA